MKKHICTAIVIVSFLTLSIGFSAFAEDFDYRQRKIDKILLNKISVDGLAFSLAADVLGHGLILYSDFSRTMSLVGERMTTADFYEIIVRDSGFGYLPYGPVMVVYPQVKGENLFDDYPLMATAFTDSTISLVATGANSCTVSRAIAAGGGPSVFFPPTDIEAVFPAAAQIGWREATSALFFTRFAPIVADVQTNKVRPAELAENAPCNLSQPPPLPPRPCSGRIADFTYHGYLVVDGTDYLAFSRKNTHPVCLTSTTVGNYTITGYDHHRVTLAGKSGGKVVLAIKGR
jgi:hypothetical protein